MTCPSLKHFRRYWRGRASMLGMTSNRTGTLLIRHTTDQRRELNEAAKRAGVGTSRWVLEAALWVARHQLGWPTGAELRKKGSE